MSGAVRISRDIFDDSAFKDEPFTEREAFIWLVMEASFKDRTKRVGSNEIALKRGQLVASTRFMAGAWKWSEARVRRYLDRLKNRRTIDAATDAGVTVVSVCKYDAYQSGPVSIDAAKNASSTHHRRIDDANENKGEIREVVEPIGPTTSAPTQIEELERVLDADHAKAVVDHRKTFKGKFTPYAAKLLAAEFAKCPDPNAAADEMIRNGWQGFKPEWIRDRLADSNVRQFPSNSTPEKRLLTPMEALEARRRAREANA